MADVVDFIASVILITASGALAPGPLFFGTLIHGMKSGARAGLSSSIGHTLVEFPLILFLALGFAGLANHPFVRQSVGILGGVSLILFGALQVKEVLRRRALERPDPAASGNRALPKSSLLLGIFLTALNPFFIFWWLSVGSKLILDALILASLLGVLLMYASHVWMDYAFLTASAYLARRGRLLVGSKGYRVILGIFGLILMYFGLNFLLASV